MGIRGLCELHAGDVGAGDSDFFDEGDFGGLDGEVFETVSGAALEDEVTEGEELVFVLGVTAAGYEVGEDDDVIWEVVVAEAASPDFELDVDVASEVAEGRADAVPVADCVIVAGIVSLGDVDAELPTANLGCIRHSWSKLRSALIGTRSHQRGIRCGGRRLVRGLGCWCCLSC